MKDQFIGIKTKSDSKNTTNEFRYFLKWIFIGVNRVFVLVYWNQDTASRRLKAKRFYLPKGIINITMLSSMKKTFMTKIWNDIKILENSQQDKVTIILLDVY